MRKKNTTKATRTLSPLQAMYYFSLIIQHYLPHKIQKIRIVVTKLDKSQPFKQFQFKEFTL